MPPIILSLWSASVLVLAALPAMAQQAPAPTKSATEATRQANAVMEKALPFGDKKDFEDAQRGLVGKPDTLTIKDEKGNVVWDLESYKGYIGLDKSAPDTVNPSLWRNAQLNMQYGLFKVTDRVYQVRGYDLSNVTYIQGNTGWIVGDPLISAETAKAAHELVTKHLGKRPIVAVVYSHSHLDHYGGVRGIVDEKDVKAKKIKIIAPERFTEEAVAENVIAGNAMGRRAIYMYGALLPRNPQGGVNGGLGQTTSTGTATLIVPTDLIKKTGQELTVDGVKMVFQMTPGTEAPAEMNMFLAENQRRQIDGVPQNGNALQRANRVGMDVPEHQGEVDFPEAEFEHQHARAGLLQDALELAGAVARVDRHHTRTDARRGKTQREPLDAIDQPDRDSISLADTLRGQP